MQITQALEKIERMEQELAAIKQELVSSLSKKEAENFLSTLNTKEMNEDTVMDMVNEEVSSYRQQKNTQ